jgi:leader peptidase (prepilin peptidase)/N-methyltransferase
MIPATSFAAAGAAGAAGAFYAGALWGIAQRVAARRALELGPLPWWLPALGGCAALGIACLAGAPQASPLAASLIGAIVCGVVDARTGFIFDALSLTVAAVSAGLALACGMLADGLIGAALAAAILGGLYLITRRRGIGLGDVKLGAALALGYGAQSTLVALGSAFVLGAAYATALLAGGRARRTDAVRFGPFIAGGAAVALVAGAFAW